MKILYYLKNRWSPRAFEEKPVSEESLQLLIEAARWAPSSMNEQPWFYYYSIKGTGGFDKMVECLVPKNREWAANSGALLLSVSARLFSRNKRPNRHAMHDTGAANAMLAAQASGLGMQVHQMGGFDMEKTIKLFNLDPVLFEPASFIAVGYPGNPDSLSDDLRASEISPRVRKDIAEISKKFN